MNSSYNIMKNAWIENDIVTVRNATTNNVNLAALLVKNRGYDTYTQFKLIKARNYERINRLDTYYAIESKNENDKWKKKKKEDHKIKSSRVGRNRTARPKHFRNLIKWDTKSGFYYQIWPKSLFKKKLLKLPFVLLMPMSKNKK